MIAPIVFSGLSQALLAFSVAQNKYIKIATCHKRYTLPISSETEKKNTTIHKLS